MSEPSILVARSDGLGDTLLSTPLLASIREAHPTGQITVLASPLGAQALAGNPRVDRLVVADLKTMGPVEKFRLARTLRSEAFDITLCLSEKFWPRVIAWLAGSRVRIGFDPGGTQPLVSLLSRLELTHRVTSRQEPTNPNPPHEVERYASLLEPLGLHATPGGLEMYLSDEDAAWGTDWLSSRLPDGSIPVVVNLSGRSRHWVQDGWTMREFDGVFTSVLRSNPRVFLIVTAEGSDTHFIDGLTELPENDRAAIVIGDSFGRWASLIASSRALIAMDTGAVHVASAFNTPVLDIFPRSIFEHHSRRWKPWRVEHRAVCRDPLDRSTAAAEIDRFSADMADALRELL